MTMTIEESYRELGLPPGSSDAQVKEAWRRLAARWHPDRNASPHALRKIQRINRALAEIRRAKTEAEPAQEAGEDIEHTVAITLEEACTGCSRELHGTVTEDCADCAGTGVHPKPGACAHCEGTGRTRPHLWFAWMAGSTECDACDGAGHVRVRCASCHGTGHAKPRKYRCRVEVPAGTRAGEVLHVRAQVQGRQRHHALALRVHVELAPHAFFTLADDGIVRCELPVDGFAWMAERWIEVPTPRGAQQMRLRRAHLTYRIKGHGLGDADCLVSVVPLFPEELSAAQQGLVDRLVASNRSDRLAAWESGFRQWKSR